ncbi:MAG: hypothetical protein GY913_00790 [Proteobacteria bacterium]|nr:hypothetical protein [Pseudomonadota bacterium]
MAVSVVEIRGDTTPLEAALDQLPEEGRQAARDMAAKMLREAEATGKSMDPLVRSLKEIPGITGRQAKRMAKKMVRENLRATERIEKARIAADKRAMKSAAGLSTFMRDSMTSAAGVIAGNLALAFSVTGILAFGQEVADLRNELSDLSVETGISADTLGALRFGAAASGKDLGNLTSGLSQFAKRMTQASRDGGTLGSVFDGLGVQMKNADGSMRGVDETFTETLTKLASVEDETLRTAAAMELFGKSGGQLVNVAEVLGPNLQGVASATKTLGIGMASGATGAAAFQRDMATLGQQMDAAKALAAPLANSFLKGLVGAFELTRLSLITMRGGFRTFVAEQQFVADSLLSGTIPTLEGMADVMATVGEVTRQELRTEVEAFRLLSGAVVTANETTVDAIALTNALAASKKDAAAASKAQAAAGKDTAKAQAQAATILQQQRASGADAAEKLVIQHTALIRTLEDLKARGADVATITAAQAAATENLSAGIDKLNASEKEFSKSAQEAAQYGALIVEEMRNAEPATLSFADALAIVEQRASEVLAATGAIGAQVFSAMSNIADVANTKLSAQIDERRAKETQAAKLSFRESKRALDQQLEAGALTEQQHQARLRQIQKQRDREIRSTEDMTKAEAKAARKNHKLARAAQVGQAIQAASMATVSLIPFFSFLGPGAPFAAAGVAGGALATQLAAIRAVPPPELPTGRVAGMSADHRMFAIQDTETVLTSRASRALGPQRAQRLNDTGKIEGGGMPSQIVAIFKVGERELMRLVGDVAGPAEARRTGQVAFQRS